MTLTQIQLAAHQIGMVRAMRANDDAELRAHQQAAAELRAKAGPVYRCYPHRNRALVKALACSLREHLISRQEFACCLLNVMEKHR
jgi:putative component of toxin-antitoxin plasmid stabilization module